MRTIVNGLDDLRDYFQQLPDIANKAASMAINDVSRYEGKKSIVDEMNEQVNFPAGYAAKNITLKQAATPNNLQATVVGRDRPTSLARFAAKGQTVKSTRRNGVRVQVKTKGGGATLKNTWLINLRNGNLGLAVRVGKGEQLAHSQGARQIFDGVYLLYGPSVDQVFVEAAWDVRDQIGQDLRTEFLRQFRRLSNG